MENIQQLLIDIGLSSPQARTYLALYRLQESQSGKLAETAQVPTSKIYVILEQLIEQGLVSVRLQNNIKVYQAASPEVLVALLDRKEQTIRKQKEQVVLAITAIKQMKPTNEPYANYKYYEGINGLKSLWNEIADKMHDDTLRIHTGKLESYQTLAGFYGEFHKHRVSKRVPAKILFPLGDKTISRERKKLPLTEIRYASLNTLAEISVVNDMVAIQHLGQHPHGFLIHDPIFADTFKEMFEKIWKLSKQK